MTISQKYAPHMKAAGLFAAFVVIGLLMGHSPAFAQAGGASGAFQPINTAATQILQFLTGSFATTAATIAVAVFGYLALTSVIRWGLGVSIILGICFIFGGAQIVQTLQSGMGN